MTQTDKKLFISDLHLSDSRPDLLQAFEHFIDSTARTAPSLYILGDLFNVWIGDDHEDETSSRVCRSLRNLAQDGTDIFIMHGNRDFLIGDDFIARCRAKFLPDPWMIQQDNQNILLMHGDTLCTLDTEYMQFRAMVRDASWQTGFLAKPLAERLAFAEQARQQSKSMSSNKAQDIMDVTPQAVTQKMLEHGADILIHGHTHRPAEHEVDLGKDTEKAKRIVLGDWDKYGWYLELANGILTSNRFLITP